MASFKVIIVGGSVTGLALANMFEQSGIDFAVLEKHETIAPEIGACLGLLPNGLRILDQLGCYDALKKVSQSMNGLDSYDEYGNAIGKMPELGIWMEELLGYRNENLDRRQVIDILFDNLRSKANIHTSRSVVNIDTLSDGVKVETADGSVFEGDIVIGADGIHSRVLKEMQRQAEIDTPGSNQFSTDCFKCTYKGLIGIGKKPQAVSQDQGFKNFRQGRSYLCVGGLDKKFYFNLFVKNDRATQGSSIPRYTEADRDALAATYANDIVYPGLTFGDIYENRICSTLLPLEEGMLETCFYKRIVLVGDSWHKSTPLFGQGGNNALVSSAFLVNRLLSITGGDETPDESRIRDVFLDYQQTRGPENIAHVMSGHATHMMDAFEKPLLKFIQLKIAPNLPSQIKWNALAGTHASLWTLRNLPVSSRQGLIPSRDETELLPRARSKVVNDRWKYLFISIALASCITSWRAGSEFATGSAGTSAWVSRLNVDYSQIQRLYFHISVTAVTSIIAVESYRPGFVLKSLSSSLPWGILSIILGWQLVAPLYFGVFVTTTGIRTFYYPSVRILDPGMLTALRPAYFLTYAPPILFTLTSATNSERVWNIAHVIFPIVIYLLKRILAIELNVDMVRKETHVQSLKLFVMLASALQIGASLVLEKPLLWRLVTIFQSKQVIGFSVQDVCNLSLELAITSFVAFSYWDIRRVHATNCTETKALLYGTVMSLLTSPATVLLLFWGFRESEWANASRKKSVGAN